MPEIDFTVACLIACISTESLLWLDSPAWIAFNSTQILMFKSVFYNIQLSSLGTKLHLGPQGSKSQLRVLSMGSILNIAVCVGNCEYWLNHWKKLTRYIMYRRKKSFTRHSSPFQRYLYMFQYILDLFIVVNYGIQWIFVEFFHTIELIAFSTNSL